MGRLWLFLALLLAALAWPAAAFAARGSLTGTTMNYVADASETNNAVVTLVTQSGSPYYSVHDPGAVITASTPCLDESNGAPDQNTMICPQNLVQTLSASLGDGDDSISVQTNLPTSIGAGGGQDTMSGGPAADFLRGGQGGDAITGGDGADQLVGDDPNVIGGGNDILDGGLGDDTEDGQDGDDVVRGGNGNDALAGGGGNDVFPSESTADGADTLSGGDGTDLADFSPRTDPLTLSIDNQANDGVATNARDNIQTDVENVTGGQASDQITGSDAGNALDGSGGDDSIQGLAGDDQLTGGGGNDNQDGGDGNDNESGGDGTDTLAGGAGNDSLAGGGDGDSLAGGDGSDSLDGGTGNDAFDGGAGGDLMTGGDGEDSASYATRANPVTVTLDGQPGDGEFLEGDNVQADVEDLAGGSGGDSFFGSGVPNKLDGGGGEDYADGGAGGDTLTGGDSGDVLRTRGSAEGDQVTCGPGPDFVVAKPADTVSPDCDRVDRGVNQKPKLRDSAVVTPASGQLQMSPTGIVRRVPLQDKVVLPLRSVVDTVAGRVKVTSALTRRKTQAITLFDGAFNITQSTAKLALTQFGLQGGDFTQCPATARRGAARAAAGGNAIRRLWASGKGKFRTKGRYASAAVRGTRWMTEDRCDGTLIRVTSGAVTVRDLVKKKTVVVKAGKTYFARAR